MKVKEALLGFILWLTAMAIVFVGFALEELPLWIVGIFAMIAWAAWLVLAFRDAERAKRALDYPIMWVKHTGRDGVLRWVAMDGSGRTKPLDQRPQNQPVFDQDGHEV